LPYELVEVDLKHKPKELIDNNPYAKVPVLLDDGGVIYESAIINEYLEEKYPATRLLPADSLGRSKARIWVDFFNSRIHPTGGDLRHGRNPEVARERMTAHLESLDAELAGKSYLLGEYSLADITFIPFYVRRDRYKVTIDDNLPNLKRWCANLLARPAVAATL